MPGPAVGRKVEGTLEASTLLAEWSHSGEPMSSWCGRRGINWYSLCAFRGHASRRPRPQGFVEVDMAPLTLPASPEPRSSRYRVVVGEHVVEVDTDFDDEVLGRLLRVVASC